VIILVPSASSIPDLNIGSSGSIGFQPLPPSSPPPPPPPPPPPAAAAAESHDIMNILTNNSK
jgi:hypothetical protein